MKEQRSLGFLLMDAARLLRKRFEQEARHLDMTAAQLQILGRLSRQEGISQVRLAAILDMEPITVCRHVDRMETAGLVERRTDPDDRRVRLLSITDKGRALIPEMRAVAKTVLDEAQQGLSDMQRVALLDFLEVFVGNLSCRPPATDRTDQGELQAS